MRNRHFQLFTLIALIALLVSLMSPAAAWADDGAPASPDAPLTGAPSGTDSGSTDAPVAQPASTQAPSDSSSTEVAAQPAATQAPAGTSATDIAAQLGTTQSISSTSTDTVADQPGGTPVPDGASTDNSSQPISIQTASTEVSATEATASATEAAVAALAGSGSVLTDQNGNPIPLASQQAADILAAGDPYILRGGTTYHFSTIQAAIDFANAGEVIYVEPGTYVEQLQIQKDLTVQGTAPGVIVQAPASLPLSFTTSAVHHSIIYVHDANDVSLVGLTVDGMGLGNTYNYAKFDGVAYYNAGGTIQNNTITGITDTPLDGMQRGVGIYAYNADGFSRNLDIIGNTILDYQKNGMALSGNNLTVDVENNTVVGAGPTNKIAQNGIQVSYGATGKVIHNTVSGNYWTGKYAGPGNNDPASDPNADSSAGILIYQPGTSTLEIADNMLTGNQAGIASVAAASLNIHDNTIKGPDHIGYGYPVGIMIADEAGWSTDVGLGTNGSITGNEITLNDYGILLLDTAGSAANVQVHQNSITANRLYGIYNSVFNSSQTTYTDAMNNWWGVPLGPLDPGTGTDHCGLSQNNPTVPANGVSPCVLYAPWLSSDPLAEVVTPGGGDNTDGNVVLPSVIPVTGGTPTPIGCDKPSVMSRIGDIQVTFTGLCGYDVVLVPLSQDSLLGKLSQGSSFVAGVSYVLLKDGNAVDVLPAGASVQVSYLKPSGNASVFAWIDSAWVVQPASVIDDRIVASFDAPVANVVMVH